METVTSTETILPKRGKLAPLIIPGSNAAPPVLPPIPGRRMSASWTDNLEGGSDKDKTSPLPESSKLPEVLNATQKTPNEPTHFAWGRENSIDSKKSTPKIEIDHSPVGKEDKPPPTEGKKHNRRESIKDQLLKFKMKAGKVFEEVHDRLVEDHSTVGPLPVMSPPAVSSDQPSVDDENSTSMDERVKSPTQSVSSKKTSNSAELKASLRSKIRKEAEKAVERTRGSIQLTRRLQRRLTTHTEEAPNENDFRTVDEQIESSLKLGEKFLAHQPSLFPPDDVQWEFFTDRYIDEIPPPVIPIPTGPLTEYRRANMAEDPDATVYVYHNKESQGIEAGNNAIAVSRMADRLPKSLFEDGLPIRPQNYLSQNVYRRDGETEYCEYQPAISWEKSMGKIDREYSKVSVLLYTVFFLKHPLESEEDRLAIMIQVAFEKLAKRFKEIQNIQQNYEKMEADNADPQVLKTVKERIVTMEQKLQQGLDNLQKKWEQMCEAREIDGYAASKLKYTKDLEQKEGADPIPPLNQRLGALSSDFPLTPLKDIPKEARIRLAALDKIKLYLELFYNDIPVGKTFPLPLRDFNCRFKEVFALQVTSVPQKITVAIMERNGQKDTLIQELNLPIPILEAHSEVATLEFNKELEPASEVAQNIQGSIICNVKWNDNVDTKKKKKKDERADKPGRTDAFWLIPPQLRLVSDEDFDSNMRWDVLEMRNNRKLPKTAEHYRIGIDSSEVDGSLLFNEQRRVMNINYKTGIDGHRAMGSNYAALLRSKLLEQHSAAVRACTYEEIVREEPLPSLFGAFGSFFAPPDESRKLKPMRKEIKRQQTVGTSDCRIAINVQSAMNLPCRMDDTLQPVVAVTFMGETACTTPVVGRNPNWQQSLNVPLLSASDLLTVIDVIQVDIYDQLVSPLERDNREVNTIHEQLIRRKIGSISIPFSTVYCRGKIDGSLRVQMPLFLTGYKFSDRPAYLKLLIALDPPLVAPRITPPQTLTSTESDKIVSTCVAWHKSCRALFEHRRFTALVSDINGKSVLASRYLRPIRAPPCVEQLSSNLNLAVPLATRIVSCIPFLADPLLFPGSTDMWTTLEQFVSIGCGDEEEHAVLLCCWLLAMHIESFVVLGHALPDGPKAAYVMAKMPDGTLLLNPSDGSVYRLDDSMCPLLSVGTVISQTNVYANIQQYEHSSHISYEFEKATDWRPVFEKDAPLLESLQPSALSYSEVTEDSIVELRSAIEREVKLRFDEARQYAIPQWNLMASRVLREILQEYENNPTISIEEKLGRLRDSYKVVATAIRIPYRSLEHCVSSVLSLHLHVNREDSAQFALAVVVQPFFNNIVSCSIGLAVMSLKLGK